MAMWERQRHTQKLSPKGPSFSSSLLDAIYRSIDDSHKPQDFPIHRRNNNATATQHEEDDNDNVESLRRAIMIEKWIETYTSPRHFPSNSASSTDSSLFSSSETDSSASKTSPKSSSLKHKTAPAPAPAKREGGRFAKTKTRAQKIYGDLKKVKEPISPGGKISNFFNSIFSPRNFKTNQCSAADDDEWSSTIRKSRSMKDTASCSLTSRSCLSKNASSRASKSKRSVRFCPVSVIVDDDCISRYNNNTNKAIYNDEFSIKKDIIDSFRVFEAKNMRKYEVRDNYYRSEQDLDVLSCASSDLFELENIGRVGEELPVYETTSLEMNQSIAAAGLVM